MNRLNGRSHARNYGFSLVELMVALAISLILGIAISSIFIQSKKTYAVQERLARIQENGRFAMYFLMKDLRMAGYAGCLDELITNQTYSNHLKKKDDFVFKVNIPIEGLEMGGNKWYPSNSSELPPNWDDSTDAVMIRMVDPGSAVTVSGRMPSPSREVVVNKTDGIESGDIVLLSDCANADVFEVTQVQPAAGHIQHATGSTGNETGELSKSYDTGAKIFKYIGRRYYIKDNDGIPTLFRDTNAGTPEPLVEGIENLQISYGKDDNSDRIADRYLPAGHSDLDDDDTWASVVSVRIGILARSLDDKDTDVNEEKYDVNGKEVGPFNDRIRRRVYASTILLRNLSP